MMENLKYNSIDELKPQYEIMLNKYSVDTVIEKFIKIEWKTKLNDLMNSERYEEAYILAMKFLSVCSYMNKNAKDTRYVQILIGGMYKESLEIAEFLQRRLKDLYANKSKLLIKTAVANAAIETQVEESATAENPVSVEPSDLVKIVTANDNGVLLMDVRKSNDYQQSHIKFNQIINIPEEICPPGSSVNSVEGKLPTEAAGWWQQRHTFREIIVLDWNDEGEARTLLNILREYDHEQYTVNVRILEKGYSGFAEPYPWLLTNPVPKRDPPAAMLLDLNFDVTYPSFDVEQDVATPFFSRSDKPRRIPYDPVGVHRPTVDRGKKSAAVKLYEGKSELLRRQDEEMTAALEVAKERSAREKELQLNLSKQRETAADEEQTKLFEEKGAQLLLLIEDLKNESFSKDEMIKSLQEQVEAMKKNEAKKIEDEEEFKNREKQMMEDLKLEEEMRKKQEETERLKKEADLLEQQQKAERMRVEAAAKKKAPARPLVPKVDRTTKPALVPYEDTKVRDFSPVFGKVEPGLTGLKNIGNTCYMNSILQCISNNVEIAKYFCERHHIKDLNRSHGTRGEVAEEVAALVQALWSGHFRSVAGKDFKSTVGSFKSEYKTYEQQDSHEFLTFLMDWLHNDLKIPEPINHKPEQSELEKVWCSLISKNYSLIWKLFYGLQKSTVSCCVCGEASSTYEPFSNLSLGIPDFNSVSLKDCISLYLKEETVSGWKCPKCKTERRAVKKTELCKLPSILVIHLKRYLDIHSKKKTTFVDFPLEGLDLSCTGKENSQSYNLYAVSNHYGTMQGGHYTAYCKSCQVKKWYKFDDHEVVSISSSDVKTAAGYILFYSSTKPNQNYS